MLPHFLESIVQLITRTSTDLPPDVRTAMGLALHTEEPATRAGQALTIIAQNIDQAASCEGPICQDTGMAVPRMSRAVAPRHPRSSPSSTRRAAWRRWRIPACSVATS